MAKARFVILVQGDGAPMVLGPMSENMRRAVLRDLSARYGPHCGLHELDVTADDPQRVATTVKRYEQEGKQA